MKSKGKLIVSGVSALLFIILIILLRCADVAETGLYETFIGLSHLNLAVHNLTGVNILWYDITDYIGYFAILVAVFFAFIGFIQLIKRKSILKIDREILTLGVLYAIVIAIYALFEVAIVNYRPIMMPNSTALEASFPSSHTMLVCVILGSTMMVLKKYIKKPVLCSLLQIICGILTGITVIGRLVSGVHWFTDILGGVIISVALLTLFSKMIEK